MKNITLLFLTLLISLSSFSQNENDDKIKYRKLSYNDFKKLSINDTSDAVIDLFYNKRDNAAFTQIILLPMTVILTVIPPTHFVGIGTAFISVPLFINGTMTLIKYRKKNLYKV